MGIKVDNMQLAKTNGKYILVRCILPIQMVTVGSSWMGSSGSIVTVDSIEDGWITHKWGDNESHTKDNFSFQCRYSLIVEPAVDLWEP